MCRVAEAPVQPPIQLRKADSSNVGTIPKKKLQSDALSKPSEPAGVVKPDSEVAEVTKPKRKRKRPDRSQSRARSRGSSKDGGQKSSEPKKPKSDKKKKGLKSKNRPPSSESVPDGKTDIKSDKGSKSSEKYPKPSEHGDKVTYRNGIIDWRFAPLTPTDLPPDRTFSADVKNGLWHCSVSKK
jgi:hypothetical protein